MTQSILQILHPKLKYTMFTLFNYLLIPKAFLKKWAEIAFFLVVVYQRIQASVQMPCDFIFFVLKGRALLQKIL